MNSAVPDEQIKELEDKRLSSPRRTGVIYGVNESLVKAIRFISNSKKMDIFGEKNSPSSYVGDE